MTLLAEFEPSLSIDEFIATSDTAAIEGRSKIVADYAAEYGFIGKGEIVVRGFDRVAARIAASDLPRKTDMLAGFEGLLALGEKTFEGTDPVYRFNIALDEDGRWIVNDQDVSDLFGK